MRQRSWLFAQSAKWRGAWIRGSRCAVVEHAELFTRKAARRSSSSSTLHDARRHLALRPEMTPSIARMVMARAGALRLPLRWSPSPELAYEA